MAGQSDAADRRCVRCAVSRHFALYLVIYPKESSSGASQRNQQTKTEPKANLFLALLGVVLLTIGFTVLRVKELDPTGLIIAAVTGIMGTYFFYSQLSVWIVRMLQRNRRTTWKGTNLLWISEMSYKIKDNARMLFLVTVVVALASMSTGFVLAMRAIDSIGIFG